MLIVLGPYMSSKFVIVCSAEEIPYTSEQSRGKTFAVRAKMKI